MRLSCMQENLSKGLALVGRAVQPRSALPVLSNVLLATDQARLKLEATNLEISITCWIGAMVEDEGRVTVEARLLTDFVNNLPADKKVDLALDARNLTLNISCAPYEAKIKGLDAQEFPIVPQIDENPLCAVPADMLREMISQVVFAAATEESRPILTGGLLTFQDNQITLVAADGYRLAVRTTTMPEQAREGISVVVPRRSLLELERIMADGDEPVTISFTANKSQVLFARSDVQLVSNLLDGQFPNYRQILPPRWNTRTVMNTEGMLKAAKIASFFARDGNNIVRLKVEPGAAPGPGKVQVSAHSTEKGDSVSMLDCLVEGPELEIAFNAKFLIDVLSVVDTPQVALETQTASTPGVLKPVGATYEYTHVIMPMHIGR